MYSRDFENRSRISRRASLNTTVNWKSWIEDWKHLTLTIPKPIHDLIREAEYSIFSGSRAPLVNKDHRSWFSYKFIYPRLNVNWFCHEQRKLLHAYSILLLKHTVCHERNDIFLFLSFFSTVVTSIIVQRGSCSFIMGRLTPGQPVIVVKIYC